MVLTGLTKMVGYRSGSKNGKVWCSATFDAIDDPLERVEYFVPDELVTKVQDIGFGEVHVTVRIYPMMISGQRTFGSRLIDVTPRNQVDTVVKNK